MVRGMVSSACALGGTWALSARDARRPVHCVQVASATFQPSREPLACGATADCRATLPCGIFSTKTAKAGPSRYWQGGVDEVVGDCASVQWFVRMWG